MTQTSRTARALIAFGRHMLNHPDLPGFHNLSPRFYKKDGYRDGLEIVLPRCPVSDLAVWAGSLTDVSSCVYRYKSGNLHAFIYGQMDSVAVCVWAAVPGDGFPDEPGDHEWDVTVQLQEA